MATTAKKEAEVIEITDGKFRHVLSKPTTIEGTEYTELVFDFEALTGADMIEAKKNRDRMSPASVNDGNSIMKEGVLPALDQTYQAFVAARAAGVHPSVILGLKARDYTAVTRAVALFLLGTDS